MAKLQFLCGMLIISVFCAAGALASEDSYPGYEPRRLEVQNARSFSLAAGSPGEFAFFAEPAASEPASPVPAAPGPSSEEAYVRTLSILGHLGVPPEPDTQPFLEQLALRQNLAGALQALSILDPKGGFRRFIQTPSAGSIDAYQDADARRVRDFTLPLASGAPEQPSDAESFHQRLLRARANPASRPLSGLRIAIDPGHMGGAFWDRETGKHVHDAQGHWLSEGVLNLQVALLLEQGFKALGAEVLLTHRELAPVSSLDFAKMDLRPYALGYLRDETLEGWFQNLLGAGPADSGALFAAADGSPGIKGVLADSPANRDEYFIRGEDLMARSDAINGFGADLALVIHFDTSDPAGDPSGVNPGRRDGTKAYITGSYDSAEVSSRADRAYFAYHWLDAASWNASFQLGRDVVAQLHSDLQLSYDQGGGGYSNEIEPGIFARNLGVSRRVTGRALTYIECLFYNDPVEFAALYDAHHPMQIGGESHPYSDRLAQVAQAIQKAVLHFVGHYGD